MANKSTAVIVITEAKGKVDIRCDGCGVSHEFGEQIMSIIKAALDQPDIIEQIKGASDGRKTEAGDKHQQ